MLNPENLANAVPLLKPVLAIGILMTIASAGLLLRFVHHVEQRSSALFRSMEESE